MSAPTRVHFTVDVECRAEHRRGDGVEPACDYDTRVWGRLANQREELGLARVMTELEARGFRGTFFVDPAGAHTFGREGLREICGEIGRRGHDLQLHLHPSLRRARWITRGEAALPDDMWEYDEAGQADLLREGIGLLAEAAVAPSRICAFRAGNFGADAATWRAMAAVGLTVSSNYNPAHRGPDRRLRPSAPGPGLFASDVPGVLELPITCFAQRPAAAASLRHLQIGAVSAEEAVDCLEQSHAMQAGHVTILTHPFEYFFLDGHEPPRGRVNHINLRRLRKVLDHLARRRADFVVAVVADVAREAPPAPRPERFPVGRRSLRLRRYAEQALKRIARGLHRREPPRRLTPGFRT
jgi:hypothetical protein